MSDDKVTSEHYESRRGMCKRLESDLRNGISPTLNEGDLLFFLDIANSIPPNADDDLILIGSKHWALESSVWWQVTVEQTSETEAYIEEWAQWVDVRDLRSKPPEAAP